MNLIRNKDILLHDQKTIIRLWEVTVPEYCLVSSPNLDFSIAPKIILVCVCVCVCVCVQSCLTLCNPKDCSLPGSSVHGISQARILDWVAIPSSRTSSQPKGRTWVSCIDRRSLYHLSHQVGEKGPWNLPSCCVCRNLKPRCQQVSCAGWGLGGSSPLSTAAPCLAPAVKPPCQEVVSALFSVCGPRPPVRSVLWFPQRFSSQSAIQNSATYSLYPPIQKTFTDPCDDL